METTPAKRLTIHTSEEKLFNHRPLYSVIVEELHRHDIREVTVTRGIAGFCQDGPVFTANIEVLSYNLPITIEATDTVDKIDSAIARLVEMVDVGVIEVTQTKIVSGRAASGEDR